MSRENVTAIGESLALAGKYQAAGRADAAERILRVIHRSRPRAARVLDALAASARRQGRTAEAVRWLEMAIEVAPGEPAYVGTLGNLHRAAGDHDKAIACYRKVLGAVPDSAAAYNNLGLALMATGRHDDAIGCYEKALTIGPGLVEPRRNIGVALLEQERPEQAVEHLRAALRIEPGSVETRTTLGTALWRLGRHGDAIDLLSEVVARNPAHGAAHSALANALRSAGRLPEAADGFARALRIDPDNAVIRRELAATYAMMGKPAAADAARQPAGPVKPLKSPRGDPAAPAIDLEPDDPRILEGLGYTYMLLEEDDNARRVYERALALDPEAATARHMIDILDGRTTARPPPGYVEALFDHYASGFDNHLVAALSYGAPDILVGVLAEHIEGRMLDGALDLGCGTGLAGRALKDAFRIGHLAGVDLSAKMVAEAAEKNIYDALAAADIVDYLQATDRRFQLVTACDVFIYIGDLAPVFDLVRRRTADGGYFCFTVEAIDGESFRLLRSARYGHSLPYIDHLANAHGFRRRARRALEIRRDAGQPVMGNLIVLQRS